MVTSLNISSWNEHGNVEPHCFIYDEEANFCKWWSHLCLCSPTDGKKQPIKMLIIKLLIRPMVKTAKTIIFWLIHSNMAFIREYIAPRQEYEYLKLVTVTNLHYQLGWWNQIILLYSPTDATPQFLWKLTIFIQLRLAWLPSTSLYIKDVRIHPELITERTSGPSY